MPELPEVEIMSRNLRRWTSGRSILSLDLLDPKVLRRGDVAALGGAVTRVWRRAKYAVLECEGISEAQALVLHFRMTGKVVPDRGGRGVRARLVLDRGSVAFEDPRRLGQLWVLPVAVLTAFFADRKLGPEPYPELRSGRWWRDRYAGLRGPIKPALMRQDRVAGLGNIAASEILWRAGIDPRCPTSEVDAWDGLAAHAHAFLHEVVNFEAGDEIEYVNAGGPNPFSIYGRAGEPCSRCGATIQRFAQAGRGTWWCPGCQPRGDAGSVG